MVAQLEGRGTFQEDVRALFLDVERRPSPQHMSSLIMSGVFDAVANLPKSTAWLGHEYQSHNSTYPSIALAVSLQLHPRYHGRYVRLEERDGNFAAVPATDEKVVDSLDCHWSNALSINNSSIVHPLAAAIVQRRIVHAALERTGQLEATYATQTQMA